MADFANQKYHRYQQIWVEYDNLAFLVAIALGLWAVLFCIATQFGEPFESAARASKITVSYASKLFAVVGFTICVANLSGQLNIYVATSIVMPLSLLYSGNHLQALMTRITELMRSENFRPKPLIYPMINSTMIGVFCLFQVIDSWQQEADYAVDGLLFLCLGLMWATQP